MDLSFDAIRKTVLDAKPVLAQVLEEHGSESLLEYFKQGPQGSASVPEDRKDEFLSVFRDMTARIVGNVAAESATRELSESWYVSTADHHGPLTHPFFFNSALMQAAANRAAGKRTVVVLSCAGISVDNSSFPRGFLVHDEQLRQLRLRLVSRTESSQPVYSLSAYRHKEIASLKNQIDASSLSFALKLNLIESVLPIYASSEALSFSRYGEQMTYSNFYLWKLLPGQHDTDLIYLEQEALVAQLIVRHHLEAETVISELLTDARWQETFEQEFDGIAGAHSIEKGNGTFLFWGIEDSKRVALKRGDERISSRSRIREGLETGTLMPSMSLTYCVLAFYYGINCGGGFSQVNYLTYMKEAYVRLLSKYDASGEERTMLVGVETRFFCGEFVLATLGAGAELVSATPLDMYLYSNGETEGLLDMAMRAHTLRGAVDAIMPELYKIVTGKPVPEQAISGYTQASNEKAILSVLRK